MSFQEFRQRRTIVSNLDVVGKNKPQFFGIRVVSQECGFDIYGNVLFGLHLCLTLHCFGYHHFRESLHYLTNPSFSAKVVVRRGRVNRKS